MWCIRTKRYARGNCAACRISLQSLTFAHCSRALQYTDAELVRKKIQAMFAFFIEKNSPDIDVIPTSDTDPNAAPPATDGRCSQRQD